MGSFIWPTPGYGRVSSSYGYRRHPVTGKPNSFHNGIDIAAGSGVPIYAARAGTVAEARMAGTYGNMILLNHGGGTKTRYAHLSKFSVRAGQTVAAGQLIGLVGATGRVTGPHLHFEVHISGKPVDPLSYVRASDTKANYTGGSVGLPSMDSADQPDAVIHIPQTEKVYTVYEDDTPYKPPDRYAVTWQSSATGRVREITDRVGDLSLLDDVDSVCLELSFRVLQATGEKFMQPLVLACGDLVSVVNTGSKECIFLGQVQTVSGSYRDAMAVTCHDAGRLLTTNDIIIQFNNVAAKTALSQLANKAGIQSISCPNLVSSVYGIEKANAADIAKNILATVTAENGVHYFLRMMGSTLVIRSFAKTCIRGWHRQEANLAAFDILDEASSPQVSWDSSDLRNQVLVYSENDSSVSIQARAEDAASIKRYGRRTALETFSDQDKITAAAKAKTTLAARNRVTESFSVTTYGSDKIMAGVRLKVDLQEIRGEFWVVSVTHDLGTPHMMSMTLRRAD